jgi:hypothetical protein
MADKRIDDSKLGGISGGYDRVSPKPGDGGGSGLDITNNPGTGGQALPEDQSSGSGNSTPFQK